MTSTLGVIFEDFYMCVRLIYKDKLQDNYSIFYEFLMNYTQIFSFKQQENGQRLSSERVNYSNKRNNYMVINFIANGRKYAHGNQYGDAFKISQVESLSNLN